MRFRRADCSDKIKLWLNIVGCRAWHSRRADARRHWCTWRDVTTRLWGAVWRREESERLLLYIFHCKLHANLWWILHVCVCVTLTYAPGYIMYVLCMGERTCDKIGMMELAYGVGFEPGDLVAEEAIEHRVTLLRQRPRVADVHLCVTITICNLISHIFRLLNKLRTSERMNSSHWPNKVP